MAIDYHDLTAITDTLKYVYGQGITNQFADEKTTYNQFPVSERKPKGLGYEFSIRYARAQGTGARAESEKLPDPLVGKFDKGRIVPKYLYGSLRLTGPMIEAAKSDVAAFVDGLADSVDDIYQSIIVDLNRQAWGDGMGKLGEVSAANATACDTDSAWTMTFKSKTGVKYFKPGMLVDFYNAAGTKPTPTTATKSALACRVSAVYPSTNKVKFEMLYQTTAGTTNAYLANHPWYASAHTGTKQSIPASADAIKMGARELVQAATEFTSAKAREMMGLLGIYDNDTLLASFENIDTGDYPDWRAQVLSNSGVARELSIDLMLQGLDLVRTVTGKSVNVMRMGLGQRRKYANLLLPDVRFQPTVLKGGYETLTFAGGDGSVQFVIDPMCQNQRIFMEPSGTIQRYEMTPLGWGNLDQQMHWRSGYDEWDMFLRLSNGGSFGEKSPSKNRVNSGNPSYLAKIMETLSQALNEDSRKVQRLDRQIVLSNMN